MNKMVPVLTEKAIIESMRNHASKMNIKVHAAYSSVLGGIVTDPTWMNVPLDDHMVHRGHAVFDTANVVNGGVFGLHFHLDRLFKSAERARIQSRWSKDDLKKIIIDTVRASKQRSAGVRMWMSAGRGDFLITPKNCTGANYFCIVHEDKRAQSIMSQGVSEVIVKVPLKSPALATFKSTNYLVNALCAMEAEDKGCYLGLQVDDEGYIAEFAIGSAGFLGKDGVFRSPKLDKILMSTTLMRAYSFKHMLIENKLIKDFVFCNITQEMARDSVEAISFGGGRIVPVVRLDGQNIGDGKPGSFFLELKKILEEDMISGPYIDKVNYD